MVANEMRQNSADYHPFIVTASGDMLDEQGYISYCDKLQNTHEWGGHVEVIPYIRTRYCTLTV